jgi:predicted RecB family nuclease
MQIQHEYEQSAWGRLCASLPVNMTYCGNPSLADLQSHRYKLVGQFHISTEQIQSLLDRIQLVGFDSGKHHREMYVPLRFVAAEKLSDKDRLCLAFDALALSCNSGQVPHVGKIIHGQHHQTVTVKLDKVIAKAQQTMARIRQHTSQNSSPPLILNRHCIECEFQFQCRATATEHDDLSLLAHFTEKEWRQHHDKGIFTITQLSYTFRPRKRFANLPLHHQHALKALAIRTNKIHVFGSVTAEKMQGVPVYVDVEGDPDRGFYYLIGVRACRAGSDVQYLFWADDPSSEKTIWADFIDVVTSIDDARIVHYGSYETAFFKRLRERYSEYVTPVVEGLIEKAVNVLSIVHEHVYFPTYSNGLKEIAQYLGFRWSDNSASGLNALVWRSNFESSHDPVWKAKLVTYNAEDCEALQVVAEKLWVLAARARAEEADVVDAATIKRQYPQRFGDPEFVLPQFKAINEAAYWDYQRSRIYVRTLPKQSKAQVYKKVRGVQVRPNKVVLVDERGCPVRS